jgi:hypothetical protein
MKAFFEGIQTLFVDFLFKPWDFLRHLELQTWWGANTVNWIFFIICFSAILYWIKQLKLHESNNEENHDSTAHSFFE